MFTLSQRFVPAVDIREDGDNVQIKAELPGIEKKDIAIEYQDGILTVSGEKVRETTESAYSEIESGSFLRRFRVGDVNFDKSTADYVNGVLQISLPKTESQKAKRLLLK